MIGVLGSVVEIERLVDPGSLGWPGVDRLRRGERLGGNRDYVDVTGITWTEAVGVLEEERALLDRIGMADDPGEEYEAILEEMEEDPGFLHLIDVGVGAAVASLSCIGCVPFASCNGGVLGDHHHEDHPLAVFFARAEHVPALVAAATRAGAGLENDASGALMLYANDVGPMHAFASVLLADEEACRALAATTRAQRP